MPVDPQVQAVLDQMRAANLPPISALPLELVRQNMEQSGPFAATPEPVKQVEDRVVPGPLGDIPIRVYTPEGSGPFPLLVFYHGGGFVLGSIASHDALCRTLTNATPCITVSVEYRLAPENPFPAGPEDCYAATQWVAEHAASFNGDPTRLAVGGDSAGGNLAAVVSLMARDRGGPTITFQLLIYPTTDNHEPGTPSLQENAQGYFLTLDDIHWFDAQYISRNVSREEPYAFPLFAKQLTNLPPALVITAEYDPLRDEGELYAQRLREAGIPATVSRYDGMIHGFVSMAKVLDKGKTALAEAAAALHNALA